MRILLQTTFILLFITVSKAYCQIKPDTLYKIDRVKIIAKVEEISEKQVIYVSEEKKASIPKADLWKIVYSDGESEDFNQPKAEVIVEAKTPEVVKMDLVIKKDKSIIEGKVNRISEKSVEYRKGSSPDGPVYEIDKRLISKIVYANGTEEILEEKKPAKKEKNAPEKRLLADQHSKESVPRNVPPADRAMPKTSAATEPAAAPKKDFAKFQATLGLDGYYVIPGKGKSMTDETNGLGLSQGAGLSARIDLRPIRGLAFSLNVGYSQWTIEKLYLNEGEIQYQSKEKMANIPVSLGLKLGSKLYIMPEAGIAFVKVTTTTSDTYPTPSLNIKDASKPVFFGGSIGYEIRAGKLLIDVSAKYQLIQLDQSISSFNTTLNQPYHFAGLRVGIGI